ncbi:MAG: MGMT family protein [Smithellaceae bacterium]|nr:MGMT family protein [Smithellaceae bacterium]
MFYQIIKAGKDEIGLVWDSTDGKLQIEAVYLPGKEKMAKRIAWDFPAIHQPPYAISGGMDQTIIDLYKGKKRKFDLTCLNLKRLTKFSASVLKQAFKIPCGKVATYSGLAARIGNPRAARAVGTVLAKNRFPLIIPCHRVIRADGKIGRFGGGIQMKRELLEREGVIFGHREVVYEKYVWP